jgi:hypothetical protein
VCPEQHHNNNNTWLGWFRHIPLIHALIIDFMVIFYFYFLTYLFFLLTIYWSAGDLLYSLDPCVDNIYYIVKENFWRIGSIGSIGNPPSISPLRSVYRNRVRNCILNWNVISAYVIGCTARDNPSPIKLHGLRIYPTCVRISIYVTGRIFWGFLLLASDEPPLEGFGTELGVSPEKESSHP